MRRFITITAFIFSAVITVTTEPALAEKKLEKGGAFPAFKLKLLEGKKEVSLSEALKGKKAVLVDFWASWCEPCKESFPELEALQKKYASKGFRVVGINVDDKAADGVKFIKDKKVSFPLLHDDGQKLVKEVGVATMPTSFLVDGSGKIHLIHKGFRKPDVAEYTKEIEALLKK